MTLVVFCATDDFLVVAADRRLTYPDKTIAENDRTKLLAWCGGLIFGFTGQALLTEHGRPEPSLMWLARRITEQEPSGTIDFPRIAAALDRQRLPTQSRRLAFAGVGFPNGDPMWVLISNMHDDEGNVTGSPQPRFRAILVGFSGTLLRTLGGELSPSAKELIGTRMPRLLNDSGAAAQVLAGAVEKSTGDYIGDQALVVTLLRSPASGRFTFDLVTPDLSKRHGVAADIASPIFVCRGAIMQMPNQRLRRAGKPS